jgi:undecaprenyl-diphosphatase
VLISNADLLNGGFFFSYLWWLWFSKTGASRDNRGEVLHIFAGIVASLTVARAVQIFLSGRNRPIDDPSIGFVLPYGADPPMCVRFNSRSQISGDETFFNHRALSL